MPVFLPRRWNRQPQYNAGVDWSNPLTRGLLLAAPDGYVDQAGQRVVTLAGTGERSPTDKGMSLRGNGNAGGSVALDLSSTGQVTISGWVFLDANTDVYRLLCEYTSDTNTNVGGFFIALTHTGVGNGQIVVNGGATRHNTTFPKPATGWTYVTVRINIAASPNPTVQVAYNNVSQTVTVSVAGTSRSTFANSTLFLLSRNNASLHLTGNLLALTVHNRLIADWEMRSLYFNPWQFFRPAANQTFYSLPSQGASTQTLTDVGNIASAEAFGTAALAPGAVTVTGAGAIASGEAFGDAVVSAGGTLLSAVGNIASAEAFGTATLVPGAVSVTSAGAISSAEAFGTATLSVGATLVTGAGNIASAETFGAALITSGGAVVTGAGNIASAETFGSSTVAPGAVSVTNAGAIASGEVFGTAALARGAVTLSSAGAIASGEAFGDPLIAGAGVFIQSAGGIASGEAFGPVPLIPQAYVAPDVRALEVLGGGRILEVAGGRRTLEVQG